jgi:ubiquitin-activating enzyme E1
MIIEDSKNDFDHNLYSRQVGTFGAETMTKFVKTRVLLIGLSGVGLEIAKNLILAGPKSVSIYDPQVLTHHDLEYNYYMKEQHVEQGYTRMEATLPRLIELNNYVDVSAFEVSSPEGLFAPERLAHIDVVVVADWYSLSLVKRLNSACNSLNKKFIFAAAAGLAGAVFVDFGQHHLITDKDGEECFISFVSSIDENGIVSTNENQRHNLIEGDLVKFSEVVGMEAINGQVFKVQKVITPYSFSIGALHQLNLGSYTRNGVITQQKNVIPLKHDSISKSIEDLGENLIDCDFDFENDQRLPYMKLLVHCYWDYIDKRGTPGFYDMEGLVEFEQMVVQRIKQSHKMQEFEKLFATSLHKFFFSLAKGQYSPVHSFFGAIAAQEIVKLTGKYTPISQWFIHEWYWSSFKKFQFESFFEHKKDVCANPRSRYVSQVALLGKQRFEKMMASKVFMVGAGALGCEYLKLFAMMGLCCDSTKGLLVVTDDDNIELSNLNRQFLFQHRHVGMMKSPTACGVAKDMNYELNVSGLKDRVSQNNEHIFTDEFWDSLDLVVSAVDNVQAREYIDHKCVFHLKPLYEAGTLGTKCNSQLILPGLTEAYGDSKDPVEKQTPMCTVRSFPNLIEHCIEWGSAKFNNLFVGVSKFLSEFFSDPAKGSEKFKRDIRYNLGSLKELWENLEFYMPLLNNPVPEMYVKFARDFYQFAFHDQIQQLLMAFPEDYVDKKGNLFWTSPKRPPVILPFDETNPEHLNFINAIVNVLQQFIVPASQFSFSHAELVGVLQKISVRKIKIELTEEEKANLVNENQRTEFANDDSDQLMEVCKALVDLSTRMKGVAFKELEFEKDFDPNGHIDFIAFTSNARATNYKIDTLPRYRIKIIAGGIIPAIATTTAMVAAANAIEIYKRLLEVPFESTRNFFSNLAIPIFMFSEPLPPMVHRDKEYDEILLGPVKALPPKHNTWSRFDIEGPQTLNQIDAHLKASFGFKMSSVVLGKTTLFSTYDPKLDYHLEMTVEQILVELKVGTFPGKRYVQLYVGGETEDMIDVNCPYVKYKLSG